MLIGSRLRRAGYLFAFIASLVALSIFPQHSAAAQSWSLPAPWIAQDIGSPPIAGSTTFNQGTFTITAGGSDIWARSDEFTFIYQQVTGDVDVIARVDSLGESDVWSKTGVMIRSSLAGDAAHTFALMSGARGVAFQYRLDDGGSSGNTAGPEVSAPYWVRLVRKDTTVTALSSPDGKTWSTIGTTTIKLGASAYVGIATTSHNPSSITTAAVSQVSVSALSLPTPQASGDIGAPAIQGSASYGQGVYTIHAGGVDIWDTSDQFHFVYQPMSGDGEVIAHVQSLGNSDTWAKTGVMIRETLAPDSRHAFALASAAAGYAFQRRIDPGGITEHTAGPAGAAPGWVRLVRIGSRIDAYQSTNGSTWTSMGSDAVPMAETVYVGLATTSHNTSIATNAVLDNFRVTQSGTTTNQPPTVAIISPSDGSSFTAGTNVTVTAAANDSDGTIGRVDFFAGTIQIGSATSAPYSATWPYVMAGIYSVTAVAYDDYGASTSSATSTITVNSLISTAPTAVAFTASADHAALVTYYELRLYAAGANPSTATPIATSNLGKPAPDANNDITVNQSTFFSALTVGNYVAAVAAVGSGGSSISTGVTFTR